MGLLQHCLYLQTMLKLKGFVPQGFTVFFLALSTSLKRKNYEVTKFLKWEIQLNLQQCLH